MRNSYRRNKLYPKKRGGMNMDQNMDQNMGQNTRVVNAAMEGDMPMPTKANNNDMPMPTKANNNDMPMANNNNCPPCPRLDENKKEEGGIMASITGFNDKLATKPQELLGSAQTQLSAAVADKKSEIKGKIAGIFGIETAAAPAAAPIEGGRRRRRTKKNKKSKKGKKGGKGKKSKKSRKGKKSKKRTIRR